MAMIAVGLVFGLGRSSKRNRWRQLRYGKKNRIKGIIIKRERRNCSYLSKKKKKVLHQHHRSNTEGEKEPKPKQTAY